MMKKCILGFISVLALAACNGGWEQDPLKEANQAIKDGQPPSTKPVLPEPVASESIRIDSADVFNMQEERTDVLEVKARSLMKDYKTIIQIENIKDFVGAKFDPASGKFSWAPPKGTVIDNESTILQLEVLVIAKGPTAKDADLVRRKTIQINVYRAYLTPSIKEIKNLGRDLREGKVEWFEVVVTDPDGGFKEEEYPVLQVLNPAFVNSLAAYVFIEDVVADASTKTWLFKLKVDLQGVEVTQSSESMGFRIRVVNRFARISPENEVRINVLTQLSNLDTTWKEVVEITPGQESIFPFLVFDPKGEGRISLMSNPKLPAGSSIQCPTNSIGMMSCVFKWNAPYNNKEQLVEIALNVRSKNQDISDANEVQVGFKLQLKVKHLAPPPPPPPPAPTPNPNPGPTPIPSPNPEPTEGGQ